MSRRYLWGPAVDQHLAEEQITSLTDSTQNETLWGLGDHQGTIRDVVDDDGDLRMHRVIDSFGNIESTTTYGAAFTEIIIAYTGKVFDTYTDLQNNWHRWYDPTVGRWASEDFIWDGFNKNAYVGNKSTTYSDPTGLRNLWNIYSIGYKSAPDQTWADFINPFNKENRVMVGGFLYGGLVQGPINIARTGRDGLSEMAKQSYDLHGSMKELKSVALTSTCNYVFDTDTQPYRHRDWSQLSQALAAGEVDLRQYYAETGADIVTVGTYSQGKTTYLLINGDITVDEASGRYGLTGGMQLLAARPIQAAGGIATRPIPGTPNAPQAIQFFTGATPSPRMSFEQRRALVAARSPQELAFRLARANDLRRLRDGIPSRLFHYTDSAGEAGIASSQKLCPSLKSLNPKDAFYGDDQYLTDIVPGTRTPAQLSRAFLGQPFQGRRFTNYVEIDVSGLRVIRGREGVFVIRNSEPLDLSGRLMNRGSN